jgi:hypothetical protein
MIKPKQINRWDAKDTTAPTVLRITATNSDFGHFTIKNSPRAHMGLTSSDNVNLHDVTLNTVSSNSNLPKNTDGLDVSSSTNIVFQNSVLTIGKLLQCVHINKKITMMDCILSTLSTFPKSCHDCILILLFFFDT